MNNPSVNASRCHLPLHKGGFDTLRHKKHMHPIHKYI